MAVPDDRENVTRELEENEAAFWAGIARIEAMLKVEHPELFDERGELRAELVTKELLWRTNGKRVLTDAEFLAAVGPIDKRRIDGP